MRRKLSIIIVLVFAFLSACSKTEIKVLNNEWHQKPIPIYESKEWSEANNSMLEWEVEYNKSLKTEQYDGKEINNKLKTSDGYFLGTDKGEFGGDVSFYPNGKKEDKYVIINENFKGFLEINNHFYVFTGLAHMGGSSGSIYKLERKSNKWVKIKVIDLKDAPFAFTLVGKKVLYVVTHSKLLKIENEKVSDIIVKDAFWQDLYPNSIVFVDNKVFIGMRKGIAQVDLKTKKMSWYIKK
jgi:hypothetical protein